MIAIPRKITPKGVIRVSLFLGLGVGIFELVSLLSSAMIAQDSPVAWGIHPMLNPALSPCTAYVETAFHTFTPDVAYLSSALNRKHIGEAIAMGVDEYLGFP